MYKTDHDEVRFMSDKNLKDSNKSKQDANLMSGASDDNNIDRIREVLAMRNIRESCTDKKWQEKNYFFGFVLHFDFLHSLKQGAKANLLSGVTI